MMSLCSLSPVQCTCEAFYEPEILKDHFDKVYCVFVRACACVCVGVWVGQEWVDVWADEGEDKGGIWF